MTEKINTKQLKSVSTDVNLGNSDVSIPTQKAVKAYVDKRVFSVYEMPDASVDYLGRALQYMGKSDANYHHGYVYECVEQTETETHSSYSWKRIDMQPNATVWGLITGSVLDQSDLVNYIMGQISPVDVRVTTIESYIPAQASALNQLADKSFVNSSIATNTATFRGTYNSLAELEAVTADENDYGFVVSVDAVGNTVYNRYKYTTATTPASWAFEYALNNSSFTATQWAAINSNATVEDIAKIATALQPGDNVSALTNDAGYLTAVALSGLTDVAISSLADGQSLIYDANAGKWKNVSSSVSVGFAAITGSPDDNVALKAVLDSKSGCILRRW